MRIEQLKYFEGKACTIFTTSINRNFKEENPGTYPKQIYNYFVGLVESVSEEGIMLRQINAKLKTFFFLNHIIGISEEEVLDISNPKHKVEIEQFRQVNQAVKKEKLPPNQSFVNPVELQQIEEKFKNS